MVETSVVSLDTPAPQPAAPDAVTTSRLRRALRLMGGLVRIRPKLFSVAVTGAAVFAVATVASSAVLRWVIDEVILPRFDGRGVSRGTVAVGIGAIIGVGIVRAVAVVVRRTWAGMASFRVAEHLADGVVDKLVDQPVPWHRRRSTGDLVARAGVDVDAAIAVMHPMPFASSVIVLLVVSSAWLLATDLVLGLAAVAVFPLLVALNVVYQRRVDRHYDEAQDQLGRLSAAVHESFEGVAVVKAFGAEDRERERLATIAARLREARMRAVRLRGTFESLLDGVPTLANVGILVLGSYRVRGGDMTVGELTSFVYLFTLLVFPLRLIGFTLSELPHSAAGWGRVREVLDEPLHPDPARRVGIAPDGLGVRAQGLRCAHEGTREVLRDVGLEVPLGRSVVLVGATGAGKTTLLHVLGGLIEPSAGLVERAPGAACLVFQEPFLLADTLRENLTIGIEREVPDDEIWAALGLADGQTFVSQLSEGLDTVVGERGVGLSGGQRQRIALARALLRRPSVLLLDDTTSALDPATEAKVLDNLRRALAASTVVAVASRPSTIALADEVIFLKDGRVVGHADHPTLLASLPDYRQLLESFEADRLAHASEGGQA